MSRAARAGLTAVLVTLLLAAGAQTWRRIDTADPRGRSSWLPFSRPIGSGPEHITVFLPACEVSQVLLHPAASASGTARDAALDVEFLRPGQPTDPPLPLGRASVSLRGVDPLVLDLPRIDAAWRRPLTLRLQAADGARVFLDPARPVSLVLPPGVTGASCVFDGGSPRLGLLLAALLAISLTGFGWLAGRVIASGWNRGDEWSPVRPSGWAAGAMAVLLTGCTALLYVLVVPPFEAPDELAHFEYARFVAATGSLPHEIPNPASEWRRSSYEWFQQPLYYLAAGGILHSTGLDQRPALANNPRSRLHGGQEFSLFDHGRRPDDDRAWRGLYLLRFAGLLLAMATAWMTARSVLLVTGNPLLGLGAGACLGLVPQWCAVMSSVTNDSPATALAAAVTLAMVALLRSPASRPRLLGLGVLLGVAFAVKATTFFLLPAAMLAVLVAPPRIPLRGAAGRLALLAPGILLAAGWIPLRAWLVFGDPRAYVFKRQVLELGGFAANTGAMPWTALFWTQMRIYVFEPFWARFGSVGAGPFPGTRLWLIYGGATVLLLVLAVLGALSRRRDRLPWPEWICAAAVALGVTAWLAANLTPLADMVANWTPRHLMPFTAPLAVLVSAGVARVSRCSPPSRRFVHTALGFMVVALAIAGLAVFRATVLQFHFGY